jgi:hypothetical protein
MRELCIFVDESGDFGPYVPNTPLYIVSLIFHDMHNSISDNISRLDDAMKLRGLPIFNIHTGQLIRREGECEHMTGAERKWIFDALFHFVRHANIVYHSIAIEKRRMKADTDLKVNISKQLYAFLMHNLQWLMSYDRVVVHYDNGQMELSNILVNVFGAVLSNIEFKKVIPAQYKLFQAADMLCTLELLAIKAERKILTKSELAFFGSRKKLHKSYLRPAQAKRVH